MVSSAIARYPITPNIDCTHFLTLYNDSYKLQSSIRMLSLYWVIGQGKVENCANAKYEIGKSAMKQRDERNEEGGENYSGKEWSDKATADAMSWKERERVESGVTCQVENEDEGLKLAGARPVHPSCRLPSLALYIYNYFFIHYSSLQNLRPSTSCVVQNNPLWRK